MIGIFPPPQSFGVRWTQSSEAPCLSAHDNLAIGFLAEDQHFDCDFSPLLRFGGLGGLRILSPSFFSHQAELLSLCIPWLKTYILYSSTPPDFGSTHLPWGSKWLQRVLIVCGEKFSTTLIPQTPIIGHQTNLASLQEPIHRHCYGGISRSKPPKWCWAPLEPPGSPSPTTSKQQESLTSWSEWEEDGNGSCGASCMVGHLSLPLSVDSCVGQGGVGAHPLPSPRLADSWWLRPLGQSGAWSGWERWDRP